MRLHISKFILLSFIGLSIGQNQSPYLDIANELLVRKKLAKKLPDVFDNAKYFEVVDKIDAFAKISPKDHETRMAVNNPEFHWCFSQTYLLANKSAKAINHYRKYKIHSLNNTSSIHALFQKNINFLSYQNILRSVDNQRISIQVKKILDHKTYKKQKEVTIRQKRN